MTETWLLIDDDVRLTDMLTAYLAAAGLKADVRATAHAGLEAATSGRAASGPYAGIILDVMLPDFDGFELCRQIRNRTDIPILMLTARGDDTDRIVGLEIGADDYLPKPFNPRELLARMRAITRRGRHTATERRCYRFGRLEIDTASRSVTIAGDARELTSYQFDLLVVLADHAGRVLSRDRLMDLIKGKDLEAFDRTIDVQISRIRAAIEDDPRHPRRIITVRGAGYVFARNQDEGKP